MKYRADIDGIRAVAVATVVLFHAFPSAVPGGFVGVDVFFVISGFLITGILLRSIETRTFSLVTFYARRIRRIFPALILVLATTFAVGWLTLLPNELAQLGKHILAAAAFCLNLVLWAEAVWKRGGDVGSVGDRSISGDQVRNEGTSRSPRLWEGDLTATGRPHVAQDD